MNSTGLKQAGLKQAALITRDGKFGVFGNSVGKSKTTQSDFSHIRNNGG
jgi:hypothetical protein